MEFNCLSFEKNIPETSKYLENPLYKLLYR